MKTNEFSVHEVNLFSALQRAGKSWLTSAEAAAWAKINARTARAHLHKLTALGIVECAEVFPGHRYRLAEKAAKRNHGYLRRLAAARDVFGV